LQWPRFLVHWASTWAFDAVMALAKIWSDCPGLQVEGCRLAVRARPLAGCRADKQASVGALSAYMLPSFNGPPRFTALDDLPGHHPDTSAQHASNSLGLQRLHRQEKMMVYQITGLAAWLPAPARTFIDWGRVYRPRGFIDLGW
jgi:hypothetical protein